MKYHITLNFHASGTWILKLKDKIKFSYSRNVLGSVPLTQYCAGGKIEENEMGAACGAYGGGKRGAQGSGGET